MDTSDHGHVALGLIFLRYIGDAFCECYDALKVTRHADADDRDEYMAENPFWVPQEA